MDGTNFNPNDNDLELVPNRMPYTNPNAISNSGGTYFTNQKSKILKLNLNIINNSNVPFYNYSNQLIKKKSTPNTNPQIDFREILLQQKNNSKFNKLDL
jgi:maltose-binding protein MalE